MSGDTHVIAEGMNDMPTRISYAGITFANKEELLQIMKDAAAFNRLKALVVDEEFCSAVLDLHGDGMICEDEYQVVINQAIAQAESEGGNEV